jgi:ComF family protein
LDGIRAAFVYRGVARELVHGLKYRGLTALGVPMAELLSGCDWLHELSIDAIVPVPLAPARRRTRGHNQAEALSSHLAHSLAIEHLPRGLERPRSAPPQARSANADERQRNVAGAYVVRLPDAIERRRIAVVDDVTTTGATLASCAVALKSAGAAYVLGLAFARED